MMHNDKYESRHEGAKTRALQRKKHHRGRLTAMLIAMAILMALAIGGTVAWLIAKDGPITNTFLSSKVSCEVNENFDGTVKSKVNVTNTGDTEAYIRVKLVTYRTNDQGRHIGGTAVLPAFTPGANWVEYGGYYYYTLPVAAGEKPAVDLIDSITLTGTYRDADGGHQSVDVMAEAIQSSPAQAAGEAWGVSISPGSVTVYSGN